MRVKIVSAPKALVLLLGCLCFLVGCQSETSTITKDNKANKDIFSKDSDIAAKVGKGWYEIQTIPSGASCRWNGQESEILIEHEENTKATVKIYLSSFYKPRICNVMFGDKILLSKSIPQDREGVLDFPVDLVKGPNVLKITSPDKSQSPAEIPELKNKDGRSLSFVVSSISVKKSN